MLCYGVVMYATMPRESPPPMTSANHQVVDMKEGAPCTIIMAWHRLVLASEDESDCQNSTYNQRISPRWRS